MSERGASGRRPRAPATGSEPRSIAETLGDVGAQLGLPDPKVLAPLVTRWREVVGDTLADHTRVRTFRDGVLVIGVEPVWASHLRYLEADITARANRLVGEQAVTAVRFAVDMPEKSRDPRGPVVD